MPDGQQLERLARLSLCPLSGHPCDFCRRRRDNLGRIVPFRGAGTVAWSADPVAGGGNAAEEAGVVVDHGRRFAFGCAKRGEERDEMVLFLVAGAGVRGLFPVQETVGAVLRVGGHGVGKPGVKGLGRDLGPGAKEPAVVVA